MKKFIFAKNKIKKIRKYLSRRTRIFKSLKSKFFLKKIKNDNFIQPSGFGFKLFVHVRNEMRRLPFFFKYYRALGINEFYVVDNGSRDGTLEFLLAQADTHVFKTNEEFKKADFGMRWINLLIHKYARNQWSVVVDVDEMLVFPHADLVNLRVLCQYLDSESKTCLKSLFLDMYSEKPILACPYPEEDSPLEIFRYFDCIFHSEEKGRYGGTQLRAIAHQKVIWKCSLVKFSRKSLLTAGHHESENLKHSDILGTILHFSFDSKFKEKCVEESTREQYARKALKYKGYLKRFLSEPNLNLFNENSIKLEGYQQLCDIKLMQSSEEWDDYVEKLKMDNQIRDYENKAHALLWSFKETK
jgi:glycosyltransferase involved in cell wall biosynthesis